MSNFVTYQVELTEANAPLIDKLNTLLLPGYGGASEAAETPSKSSKSASSSASKASGKKITMAAVKKAVTASKKEHGMDFINECIEDAGGDTDQTIAKNVASVDPGQYEAFLSALEAGPSDTASEDDDGDFGDDDDFDDIEDEETVSVDDVKAAVKAYAKEHGRNEAKAVMKKHKVGALSDIDDLPAAKLTKLFGAVA